MWKQGNPWNNTHRVPCERVKDAFSSNAGHQNPRCPRKQLKSRRWCEWNASSREISLTNQADFNSYLALSSSLFSEEGESESDYRGGFFMFSPPPPSKAKCHFQAPVARRYLTWLCLSQRRRAIRRRKVKARLHVCGLSCFPLCLLSVIKAAAGWCSVFFGSSPSQMCLVGEATEQWWTCRNIQTSWWDRTAV